MHVRTTQRLRVGLSAAAIGAISLAGISAASASGGSGSGGGGGGGGTRPPLTCVITSVTTIPNVIGTSTIAVAPAGSIRLVQAATGLTITNVSSNSGWSGSIGLATGVKVGAQWDNKAKTVKEKVEVRWAPAYYGAGNPNVVEIKTCS